MMWLRKQLDRVKPLFEKNGKYEKFHAVFDAFETFLFVPNHTTGSRREVHVRDAMDLKRMMVTVIVAMIPCLLFGMWNVGHQHALATGSSLSEWDKFIIGLQATLPIIVVAYAVGLGIEFTFASLRKHQVNEGFLVTGMLIPLVMPPTIPLWQVALATAFAVILAKEVFGGTGMNILNVALTARAFLYFAYPADIAGSGIWVYTNGQNTVDGYTGETALAIAAQTAVKLKETGQAFSSSSVVEAFNQYMGGLFSFEKLFIGTIPGSIGETSALMCLIGAVILIWTGVGSWKIILSAFGGAYLTALLMNAIAGDAYMAMPAHYHLVIGGLAFGIVFMATDPVSATHTETGKWIYGFLIGVITILIRVWNPAYPEGIMLAILFMNVMAPIIDFYVVEANKKRRLSRAATV